MIPGFSAIGLKGPLMARNLIAGNLKAGWRIAEPESRVADGPEFDSRVGDSQAGKAGLAGSAG